MSTVIEVQNHNGSPLALVRSYNDKCDTKTNTRDKTVTAKSVTSLSLCVLQILESDPDRKWCPQEIAKILQANPDSVRQSLRRLSSSEKGSDLVIKIGYGLYQYSAEKNGQLSNLVSQSGRIGIENLAYVTLEARYPEYQSDITEKMIETGSKRDKLPSMKPGYPRHLSTGQEIQWEIWGNGSERVSFVSHGNPFSVDLILYLHEELTRDGLKSDKWKRVSVEINKDGRTMTLNPECMTFQDTRGVLLKAYNHGQQARFEVADRTPASMKDTLSLFLNLSDNGDGKTALREVRAQGERLTRVEMLVRTAFNVGTKERDVRTKSKHEPKAAKKTPALLSPSSSHFQTGTEIQLEQEPVNGG